MKNEKPATKQKSVKKFDFRTIKSFEDACKQLNLDPESLPDVSMLPEEFRKAVINGYKLFIIYKAINNGWTPNWNDSSEWKYYPWFWVEASAALSSGFGFSVFRIRITAMRTRMRLSALAFARIAAKKPCISQKPFRKNTKSIY